MSGKIKRNFGLEGIIWNSEHMGGWFALRSKEKSTSVCFSMKMQGTLSNIHSQLQATLSPSGFMRRKLNNTTSMSPRGSWGLVLAKLPYLDSGHKSKKEKEIKKKWMAEIAAGVVRLSSSTPPFSWPYKVSSTSFLSKVITNKYWNFSFLAIL